MDGSWIKNMLVFFNMVRHGSKHLKYLATCSRLLEQKHSRYQSMTERLESNLSSFREQ